MASPVTRRLATAQRAILRAIFRAIGDDLVAALGTGDTPLTPARVNAALVVADARLDALFGAYLGDPTAVFWRLTVASTTRARLAPLAQAVAVWRAALGPAASEWLDREARADGR